MRKSDLKTGMKVELRDGSEWMCLGDNNFLKEYEVYNYTLLSDNLLNYGFLGAKWDIVKVYAVGMKGQLIWERSEETIMTIEEIEKALNISNLKIKK